MNITLSVDEQLVERARKNADAMGTSLNQLVRDYIKKLARVEDTERIIEEFEKLSGKGDSGGWRFNRDELYERR
jgi:antitoxin component of RelBE/YafQ-DinJ toxin-antitoxin module